MAACLGMTAATVIIIAILWVLSKRLDFAGTKMCCCVSGAKSSSSGGTKVKRSKTRVTVASDGVNGFFARASERARKLDRGEELAPEIVISFQDPSDMLRVLSAERVRLLRLAKERPLAVSELAGGLKRDTRAVSRDVDLLEEFGLLQSRYVPNPGHGKRRIVHSRASRFQLEAAI
jgi:predicted transcriptional regulator